MIPKISLINTKLYKDFKLGKLGQGWGEEHGASRGPTGARKM